MTGTASRPHRGGERLLGTEPPPLRRRPLPEIEMDLGPWLPGWVLRGLLALVVVAAGAVVAPEPGWTVAAALAAVVVIIVPRVARAGALVAGFAALALLGEPGLVTSAVATLGAHLSLVLGRWAGAVPVSGRVEVAVMRRAAPGLALVQVLAQVLVLLAWIATGAVDPNGWVAVGALLVVAGAAVVALRALRRAAAPPPAAPASDSGPPVMREDPPSMR